MQQIIRHEDSYLSFLSAYLSICFLICFLVCNFLSFPFFLSLPIYLCVCLSFPPTPFTSYGWTEAKSTVSENRIGGGSFPRFALSWLNIPPENYLYLRSHNWVSHQKTICTCDLFTKFHARKKEKKVRAISNWVSHEQAICPCDLLI